MNNNYSGLQRADGMEFSEEPAAESDVENLYAAAQRLPVGDRAELVKKLLGSSQDTTFSFGMGSHSSVNANTMYQFNLTDHRDVAAVLEAIASRIRSEPQGTTKEGQDASNERSE